MTNLPVQLIDVILNLTRYLGVLQTILTKEDLMMRKISFLLTVTLLSFVLIYGYALAAGPYYEGKTVRVKTR